MATNDQRSHMQAIMKWMISSHTSIGYNQHRPMANIGYFQQEFENKVGQGWTTTMDCSEFATLLCRWSGCKDPSGMGYNGYGNSSTMYDHLTDRTTDPTRAHTGAIVVFGDGGALHAAVVMYPGSNPTLCSHGSTKGPISIPLNIMQQSLGSGVSTTFLSIAAL